MGAQALIARLDRAQPVAGAGGDVAYLAPLAGLVAGMLCAGLAVNAGRGRVTQAGANEAEFG